VAANGGSPKQLIAVDPQKGESAHGPQLLPDGRSVLFTLNTGTGWDNAQVVAQEMDTGERYLLVDGGADGRYVPTGHIVFVQGSTLYASACDIDDFEVAGSRVPLVENLRLAAGIASPGTAQFSISSSGTIAYIKKPATRWLGNLVWVDRDGVAVPINDDVRSFGFLSLSPNGQSAAVTISEGLTREIWIYDLTGTRPPFPIQRGGCSWDPVWTADGRRVVFAYAEVHNSTEDLYSFSVDGKDLRPEIFHGQIGQQYPYAVSADGKELYFCNFGGGEKWDVWVYDMTGASDPKPLLASDFREVYATTSPDKRWIAYSSNRTGRPEIWIASYPSLEQRQPVSTDGGYEPRWSHDGRELFYRIGGRMMVVAIKEEGGVVSFEPPGVLFEQFYWGPGVWPSYGVAPDGRFLMIQRADAPPTERDSDRIRIVLNWFEELERLVPTD
jgi:serine/threonine-protein kinase